MRLIVTLMLVLLLSACALAKPEFLYYTTSPCGNDYHTRCTVEPQETGAKFAIYHGFMQSPLVEEGTLTAAEWADFQKKVIQIESPIAEKQEGPFFMIGGHNFEAPKLKREGRCSDALQDAFAKTKPGECFYKWLHKQ